MCGSESISWTTGSGGQATPARPPIRAVLSDHARKRCVQRRIPTKRVKAVLRDPEVTMPSLDAPGRQIAFGQGLKVPFIDEADGTRIALSVMWRDEDEE